MKNYIFILLIFVILYFSPLVISATIEDLTMSDMAGYKVERFDTAQGPVYLALPLVENCKIKPDGTNDGYKVCSPELIIWNKRSGAITLDMLKDNFDLDITKPISNFSMQYSTNEYIYNETIYNETCGEPFNDSCYYDVRRVGWNFWHDDDGSNYFLPSGKAAGIKLTFEIPQYSEAQYNVTYVPTDYLIDPEIGACGTLSTPNAVYTLNQSINTTSTCFEIGANNVTIDFNGYTIRGDGTFGDYGVKNWYYNDTTIRNGTINGFGPAIYSFGGNNKTLENMLLYNSTSAGFQAYNINGFYINNINITGVSSTGSGLLISGNNVVVDNFYGSYVGGACLSKSAGTRIIVNNFECFNQGTAGIALTGSSNNIFTNVSITGGTRGIEVGGNGAGVKSNNNTFANVNIVGASQAGIILLANNNAVNFNNTFINATYNNISFSGTGPTNNSIYRKWWYQAKTTNSTGEPINGIVVVGRNSTSQEDFATYSVSNGLTPLVPATDYYRIGSTYYYYSNHSITASGAGYSSSTHSLNFSLEHNVLADPFQLTEIPSYDLTSRVTDISVFAVNPDPTGKDQPAKYGVVVFNPTNHSVTVTNATIDGSTAIQDIFNGIVQGDGDSYPTTGWNIINNDKVWWSGSLVIPNNSIQVFWINIDPKAKTEIFNVSYSAVIDSVQYFDPHNHTTEEVNGNIPSVMLAYTNATSYPFYKYTINNSNSLFNFNISLQEANNKAPIPSGSDLIIQFPDNFSSLTPVGGNDWSSGVAVLDTITARTTADVQNRRISYAFKGSAYNVSGGLYVLNSYMSGTNARAILEGGIKVLDVLPPVTKITYPLNTTYATNVSQLNYTVSDETNISMCWYSKDLGETNSTPVYAGTNFNYVVSVEGNNTWRVYCNDTSDNVNYSQVTFFKDTIPPTIDIISPLNQSYSYSGVYINITSDGDNIWFNWNGTNVTYTTPINTTFAEGVHTLYAWANDSVGNENVTNVTFTVDFTAPYVWLYVNDTNLEFGLDSVYSYCNVSNVDLDTYIYNVTYPNGSILYERSIENSSIILTPNNLTTLGNYTFSCWANDTVSNYNSSQIISVVNDTLPPTIFNVTDYNESGIIDGVIERGDNVSINATVIDYGVGTSNVWIIIWESVIGGSQLFWGFLNNIVGDLWIIDIATNYSFPTGIINYTIYANDTNGLEVNESYNFAVKDTIPPLITIHNPLNQSYDNATQLVNITADDHVDSIWYNWNGTNVTYTSEINITFPDGTHTLYAYANDSLGHESSDSVTFTIDSTSPTLIINTPINGNIYDAEIAPYIIPINISANDTNLDIIWFNWNGTNVTYSSVVNGSFPEGVTTIYVWANDSFGNLATASSTFTVAIERIIPILVDPINDEINDQIPYLKIGEILRF